MGEAKQRSREEQRRLERRAEIRKTLLPRIIKAVVMFFFMVTILPLAIWAAVNAFKDNKTVWD